MTADFVKSSWFSFVNSLDPCRERSGSVVEYLIRDRGVVSSCLTRVTALCPFTWLINPNSALVLVQPKESLSRHNWKIVGWDVKSQIKQT